VVDEVAADDRGGLSFSAAAVSGVGHDSLTVVACVNASAAPGEQDRLG